MCYFKERKKYFSIHPHRCTAELVVQAEEDQRRRLASTFDSATTRGAAGPLVESILHQQLCCGSVHPFGIGGNDLSIRTLIGLPALPVYLRPRVSNFATVDSIAVTDAAIWLIQATVSDSHKLDFKALFTILQGLKKLKIKVEGVRLVYCLIGTNSQRVAKVVHLAANKLKALKAANDSGTSGRRGGGVKRGSLILSKAETLGKVAGEVARGIMVTRSAKEASSTVAANQEHERELQRELGQTAEVANLLLPKFDVAGYSFANLKELTRVWPE